MSLSFVIKHTNKILILAVLLGLIFWIVIPFLMAVLWSLVDPAYPWSYPDLFPKKLSLSRWSEIWQTTGIKSALQNSYMLAPAAAILSTLMALPTAYALGRLTFKGKQALQVIVLLPMVIPGMISALFFTQLLINLEFYNKYIGILVGHIVLTLPYSIRILSTGFSTISQDLIDAARDLGAGTWRVLKIVYLPTMLPSICATLIFTFIISIEEFNIAFILGTPDFTTVPTILYSYLGYNFVRPNAAVISLVLVIPNVILMIIVEKLLHGDRVYQGGNKG